MVRAPLKGEDYFCRKVNSSAEKVQEAFLEAVKSAITMSQANAMLGDGTITQADTFDPQNVQKFFQQLGNALEDWTFSGVLKSTTEDMHRFTQHLRKRPISFTSVHILASSSMSCLTTELIGASSKYRRSLQELRAERL